MLHLAWTFFAHVDDYILAQAYLENVCIPECLKLTEFLIYFKVSYVL